MAENRRPDRLAEAIREEVARFLNEKVKDPRITGMVTVTAVEVTRDLRTAKVFVSLLGADENRDKVFEGLDSLAGHLRARLGKSLGLRSAPEIFFRHDESVARAARIETLLAQIKEGRPEPDAESGG
ncbi:MAG: 30S ribosome-binding factor RbfA [Gemmatimonadaceae bacterium]